MRCRPPSVPSNTASGERAGGDARHGAERAVPAVQGVSGARCGHGSASLHAWQACHLVAAPAARPPALPSPRRPCLLTLAPPGAPTTPPLRPPASPCSSRSTAAPRQTRPTRAVSGQTAGCGLFQTGWGRLQTGWGGWPPPMGVTFRLPPLQTCARRVPADKAPHRPPQGTRGTSSSAR